MFFRKCKFHSCAIFLKPRSKTIVKNSKSCFWEQRSKSSASWWIWKLKGWGGAVCVCVCVCVCVIWGSFQICVMLQMKGKLVIWRSSRSWEREPIYAEVLGGRCQVFTPSPRWPKFSQNEILKPNTTPPPSTSPENFQNTRNPWIFLLKNLKTLA
jgi:hypothetical protein